MSQSDEQYRPLNLYETSANYALTTHINDQADSINNCKRFVKAYKIVNLLGNPVTTSEDSDTNENVSLMLGKHFIGDGYSLLRAWYNTKRASGSNDTTWRLVVASGWLYASPQIYNSNDLDNQNSITWTTSGGTIGPVETQTLDVSAFMNQWVWLYLTSQNDDNSTVSELWALDVQLTVGE